MAVGEPKSADHGTPADTSRVPVSPAPVNPSRLMPTFPGGIA